MTDVDSDEAWEATLDAYAERMRMALAEAGYPGAHVYSEWSGVFVEGVPEAVADAAADVANGRLP